MRVAGASRAVRISMDCVGETFLDPMRTLMESDIGTDTIHSILDTPFVDDGPWNIG